MHPIDSGDHRYGLKVVSSHGGEKGILKGEKANAYAEGERKEIEDVLWFLS